MAQVACQQKSNDISATPELLERVHCNGVIITIDAMGTQKQIAKKIVDKGADYVLSQKGNQKSSHQAVVEFVDEQLESDLKNCGAR